MITTDNDLFMDTVAFKKISVEVPQNIDTAYFQEAISAILYHQGILSLKDARTLAGKSRREFEETTLPKFGFTIMDGVDMDDEINNILNNGK